MTRLSQFIVDSLAKEYQSGVPTSELGRRFRLSPATVCRALRSAGIEPKRKDGYFVKAVIDESVKQDLINRFKGGQSVNKICNELHLHHYTVSNILREEKCLSAEHIEDSALRKLDVKAIAAEYATGDYSKGALADKYKVPVNTISRALAVCGVQTRKLIPDELLEEIITEYRKGFTTVADLAKIYDLHPFLLRYHLTKAGLDVTVAGSGASAMETKLNAATGVPAGRFRKTCREASPEMFEVWYSIATSEHEETRDRIKAAELIVAYGHGRPKEGTDDEDPEHDVGKRILKAVPKSANLFTPSNGNGNGNGKASS